VVALSPWVKRFAPLIPAGGEVLDLACGDGRHTHYLAGLDYRVAAVNCDEMAQSSLAGVTGVTVYSTNLEGGPWSPELFGGRYFAGIVVVNYLWRPLLPLLLASLDAGGVYIHETFMTGHEHLGAPSDPAHWLRPGELLNVVRNRLTVVAFEQGEVEEPQSAMVQRICAVRGGIGRLG